MLVASFIVIGAAVPKGRPIRGRNRTMRTPKKTIDYENVVSAAAVVAMGNRQALTGPVRLVVREYRVPPASWSKKKREAALRNEMHPTAKPDLDNVAKAIKDAMNGIVYEDDAQVCSLGISKLYGHEAQVEVEVFEW